jgi:hypothetical protein
MTNDHDASPAKAEATWSKVLPRIKASRAFRVCARHGLPAKYVDVRLFALKSGYSPMTLEV